MNKKIVFKESERERERQKKRRNPLLSLRIKLIFLLIKSLPIRKYEY